VVVGGSLILERGGVELRRAEYQRGGMLIFGLGAGETKTWRYVAGEARISCGGEEVGRDCGAAAGCTATGCLESPGKVVQASLLFRRAEH
jgi:hypothetical protein